jgi:hypothetical protein
MRDLNNEREMDEELEARLIIAKEWNQFRPPSEIDDLITEMYWENKSDHDIILSIIHKFDTLECYARKCLWFSSTNIYIREKEEKLGAYYNSGMCKSSCIPKKYRISE